MKKYVIAVLASVLLILTFGCVAENESSLPEQSVFDDSFSVSDEESEASFSEEISEEESAFSEVSEETGGETSSEVSISEESEASREESEAPAPEASQPETSAPETSQPEIVLPPYVDDGNPIYLDGGFVLYKGAAYTQSFFSATQAPKYAEVYDRYAELFPESRISVAIAPLATILITDPDINARISSQSDILDKMEAAITNENINFVNLKNIYNDHLDEYLYFKSDHHWTQRGAYYAYAEFVRSVGFEPTPIEEFEIEIIRENYIGSMYGFTNDYRVKYFVDTIEAYMPRKECTMTIHGGVGVTTYKTCIITSIKAYAAFIGGDHGYMIINVPENDQDKCIMVIKDSYANACIPFLTEHYGNIIVVDPRYAGDLNVCEAFSEYEFDDILFMVNSSMGNTGAWNRYFAGLID